MGLYIGCSPSHAANVSLIFDPRTGHVSPQFDVIYDNHCMTVPFLCMATVPPHWPELVRASSNLHVYTVRQVVRHLAIISRLLPGLVGKSAWNSAEFCNYSNSGPFELQNFHWNFIFPIVKCVPTNSKHVPAGSKSSPAINSSDFMDRKMFQHSFFEMAATGVE
jgi:hypothetical protein